MIEAMADGAVKMGLSRDTAQKLAAHTLMVFILSVSLLHCNSKAVVRCPRVAVADHCG